MNFVEFVKENWDSLVNSEKNEENKKKAMQEIADYFEALNSTDIEKPVLPDAPDYEEMDYKPPTDEELASGAEGELGEYKNSGINAIDGEIAGLKKKYDADKKLADEALKQKNEAVDSAYGNAKTNTDNDLLKRGIARSSIAANKTAQLEGEQARLKSDAAGQYLAEVTRLDGEIGGLEAKRNKALDDFNIAYAAKLTKSIGELKAQREQKTNEALKYNNSLADKKHQAQIDKVMKESELYGEKLTQKEKEEKLSGGTKRNIETYNVVSNALRGMNKNDARMALKNSDYIRKYITDDQYYLLYNEFGR